MGNNCTLVNDTKYPVRLEDYDTNRMLDPGDRQGNWLAKGGNYYIELEIQFPTGTTVKRPLKGCDFNNETKYMSDFFRDVIEEQERKERMDAQVQDMYDRERSKYIIL